MKIFTGSDAQKDTGALFNSVQKDGSAMIKHRSRPDMVLIDKEVLEKALLDNEGKAEIIADLTF